MCNFYVLYIRTFAVPSGEYRCNIAVLHCRQVLVIVIRQMAAPNVHVMRTSFKVHNYAVVYCVVNNNKTKKNSMQSMP